MSSISTNISAMSAQRNLGAASARSASSLSKLSSGSRVPTAKEDAASLAVGTGLKLDVTALKAAQTNAKQATSMLQIADGAFGQISDVLNRMKSLATTAQSDQLSSVERGYLNDEFTSLQKEINRIAGATEFNGIKLLGGSETLNATMADQAVAANGVVAVSLDASKVNADDTFELSFEADSNALTLTNSTTGKSESVVIPDITASSGQMEKVEFNALGVSVTLSDVFNTGADLAADGTTDITAVAGSSIAKADLDFQVGTGADDKINVSIDAGNYKSLAGATTTVTAGTPGTNIEPADGFAAISVDSSMREAGEVVTIAYDDASDTMSVSVADSDGNVIASQALEVTAAPAADTFADYDFDELGIKVTLNEDFAVATDVTANNTVTLAAGTTTAVADISTAGSAAVASEQVDAAAVAVNSARANLGSSMNRLEFASSNLSVQIENTEAARSSLMDVDVSEEMTKFSSEQVLVQAGVSMLAQANQQPSLLLRLLQ